MGSCKCGSKTIPFKKTTLKKADVKKTTLPPKGDVKKLSGRAKRLSAQATKKAKANAVPCKCTA